MFGGEIVQAAVGTVHGDLHAGWVVAPGTPTVLAVEGGLVFCGGDRLVGFLVVGSAFNSVWRIFQNSSLPREGHVGLYCGHCCIGCQPTRRHGFSFGCKSRIRHAYIASDSVKLAA